ncbi:MAG: tripartite tricarboxylate transporter substrate binding protein [Rubrivivax sp.]|jgi:tripartite-type tricarboxylate transporter receptor subunit TctC|nr:tripartite tricarboxylate transporter substrate binding protein [Rubrivivax sp.]
MIRRTLLSLAAALLGCAAVPSWAQSEAWPSRPVTLVVPFAPGGPTDTVARLLAERLQAQWKQTVVLDYKPGGGTMVGTQAVARANGDGHTLGMAISALMINPALQPKMPYDTLKDLAPVALIGQAHFGLFAHPSLEAKNIAELVAYAQRNPGKLSYATPGIGTGTHLAGELMQTLAGVQMVHVPYRGSAPAQQDVIAGRVPLLFDVQFSAMPFVREGRLKLLALASPKRSQQTPEVPTMDETLPGFSAMSLIGVIAPRATPRALVDRIAGDIATAVRSTEMGARMAQLGMEPVGSSAQEYEAIVRTEIAKWAQVVKTAGIKLE